MRTLIVLLMIILSPIYVWGQFDPENPGEPSLTLPNANFGWNTFLNRVKLYNSSEKASRYEWNFGDGSAISKEKDPVHTYSKGGTYKVLLTAINGHDKDTLSQEIIIPPKEQWVLNGEVTLDKNSTDIRNYISLESLFNDLIGVRFEYNLIVRVARSQTFELSPLVDLTKMKDLIISKIKASNLDFIEIKADYNTSSGTWPTLKLWPTFNIGCSI